MTAPDEEDCSTDLDVSTLTHDLDLSSHPSSDSSEGSLEPLLSVASDRPTPLEETKSSRCLRVACGRFIYFNGDEHKETERKSLIQLVYLSSVVCGIGFSYAAETAFVSPISLEIGLPPTYMSMIWCISPLVGFFLVPVLGSMSDQCQSRLGRRRPFILALSACIILGLTLIPHGVELGILFGDTYAIRTGSWNVTHEHFTNLTEYVEPESVEPSNHPWGIFFTILGLTLQDFGCDSCLSPCRAYLLDVTNPADHSRGLATFALMAGCGGCFGSILGAIDWNSTEIGRVMNDPFDVVFTLVLVLFVVFLLLTITADKEVPLPKLEACRNQGDKKNVKGVMYKKFENDCNRTDIVDITVDLTQAKNYGTNFEAPNGTIKNGVVSPIKKSLLKSSRELSNDDPEENPPHSSKEVITLTYYLKSIVKMPASLRVVCLTSVICWMAQLLYGILFTDFVGQAVYGGDPLAPHGSEAYELYQQGVRTGCIAKAVYYLTIAGFSTSIKWLVERFSARPVYILSELGYSVGCVIMAVTRDKYAIVVLAPTCGVMYATQFTMPYLLVAHYHSTGLFEANQKEDKTKEHSKRGLGTDIAVVSATMFVAQFVLLAFFGMIVDATGTTVTVMWAAALLSFLGACCASQITYLGL